MKIAITLFLGLFISASVNASDFKSELFYKADAGQTFVELGYLYLDTSIEAETSGIKLDADQSKSELGFRIEHGYNSLLSLYIGSGYSKGKTKTEISILPTTETKSSGISPLNFGARIQQDTDAGHLIAELDIDYNFEKEDCKSNGECNSQDGSTNASLVLGHIWDIDNAHIGMQVSVDLIATDQKSEAGTNEEQDKGYSFTAFYEALLSEKIIGLGSISHVDLNDDDDTTFLSFLIGTRYEVSDMLHLQAGLNYSKIKTDFSKKSKSTGFLIGARYHF